MNCTGSNFRTYMLRCWDVRILRVNTVHYYQVFMFWYGGGGLMGKQMLIYMCRCVQVITICNKSGMAAFWLNHVCNRQIMLVFNIIPLSDSTNYMTHLHLSNYLFHLKPETENHKSDESKGTYTESHDQPLFIHAALSRPVLYSDKSRKLARQQWPC